MPCGAIILIEHRYPITRLERPYGAEGVYDANPGRRCALAWAIIVHALRAACVSSSSSYYELAAVDRSAKLAKQVQEACLGLRTILLLLGLVVVPSAWSQKVDRIVVVKSQHVMTLFSGSKAIKTYRVSLGTAAGAKQREGDHKTPEGIYRIDQKNAQSHYHLALHISYPNVDDRMRAQRAGVPPGSAIMIHGLPNGFAWMGSMQHFVDWTDGCIAVNDAEIEEIWELVSVGTVVEIKP